MHKFFLEKRFYFILTFKVVVIILSFVGAFSLRFDLTIPDSYWPLILGALPILILIKVGIFWRMELIQGWWRYVSMVDLINIVKANLVASVSAIAAFALLGLLHGIPRSVLLLDGILCFLFICGVRFVTRALRENYLPLKHDASGTMARLLIVGAGNGGQTIAREIRLNPSLKKYIVGFIDDDPTKLKNHFMGIPVVGARNDIPLVCEKYQVQEIVIAIPAASGRELRDIMEHCKGVDVKVQTLPGVGELIDGRVSVQQVRDVDVEDLLGRKTAKLDIAQIEGYLKGKRILITGAAGSIGSEVCRQVVRFGPTKMILFDHAESPLFHIERELLENHPNVPVSAFIGDIRDKARAEDLFEEFLPEVVFHAAAYKHVPMMEYNPAEAINNNVRGTQILADAAHAFKVKNFVLISTDKAVNPTNVMGATKRAAELYVQNLAHDSKTNFVTVRFGNVLGSAGSVIPIFKQQIKNGGPVTVTHPDVTRFFMTIPEATQLVLQAGSMGRGGEVFLLDMGEPVKISQLAEDLVRLSGFVPYEDIDIVFTGLRPGEKLHEELLLAGEGIKPTNHEKIMVANGAKIDMASLTEHLEDLYQLCRGMDMEGLRSNLKEVVPEYRPESVGKGYAKSAHLEAEPLDNIPSLKVAFGPR